MEAVHNGLSGEQTWPTDSEMMMTTTMADNNNNSSAGRDRRVLPQEKVEFK